MKTSYQFLAASAAFVVAVSGLLATPAQARHRMKRHHHTMRHHHTTRHHMTMHRSSMRSMTHGMTGGSLGKGGMNGGATGTTGAGMANPAMSTAPATSGGDKP